MIPSATQKCHILKSLLRLARILKFKIFALKKILSNFKVRTLHLIGLIFYENRLLWWNYGFFQIKLNFSSIEVGHLTLGLNWNSIKNGLVMKNTTLISAFQVWVEEG